MLNIPYLQVNIAAFCCFFLIFVTVAAARKTHEIVTFMALLGDMSLWAMGSVLMRIQAAPGLSFWYYISVLALFALPAFCYVFVCSFVREKATFSTLVIAAITVIMLAVTPTGIFLAPPTPDTLADGSIVFRYTVTLWVAVPTGIITVSCLFIIKVMRHALKQKGAHYPGMIAVILALVISCVGNLFQLMPGNVFPADMLSGIVAAILIVWALYRKHMFSLTLFVSRTVITALVAVVCIAGGVYCIAPMKNLIMHTLKISEEMTSGIVTIIMSLLFTALIFFMKALENRALSRERRLEKKVSEFSSEAARNLEIDEVILEIVNTIVSNISVNNAYVCLPGPDGYSSNRGSGRLNSRVFTIANDSPILTYLTEEMQWIIMDDFRRSPMYQSLWQSEKDMLDPDRISCILPLKDQGGLAGLIVLGPVSRGNQLTYEELNFASTIASISTIAVKNASLYRQVFREARIDSLTGAFNYNYFIEELKQQFAATQEKGESLALIYLDVDDMKLYNQLYGQSEGDRMLIELVGISKRCVGEAGKVFRYGGKIFAILMPGADRRKAESVAEEIQRLTASVNDDADHSYMRPVSLSCGICVAPFGASSYKELTDNADIAVYHAKSSGKNKIRCFENGSSSSAPRERALRIIDRSKDSTFRENAAAINALTAAIDAKDHYTCQHSQNVAEYASILAAAMGMTDEQILLIYEAGLMHDIGKISIPESILGKTEKLTDDEYRQMKKHVDNSIDMIRHLTNMDYLIPAVVGHHERWDGKGYPRKLAGENIPLTARCLAVADAFDAMTTNRPYRKSPGIEYACGQIEKGAGTQFDPELAYKFAELIRAGEIRLQKQETSAASADEFSGN